MNKCSGPHKTKPELRMIRGTSDGPPWEWVCANCGEHLDGGTLMMPNPSPHYEKRFVDIKIGPMRIIL